jgi:hypothetical protein
MSELQITPYVGIGPIRFGISKAEVRASLAVPVREFRKTPSAVMPTDAFPSLGLHIYYKLPGLCEAVEAADPAKPTLFGKDLIAQPFNMLHEWLRELDEEIKVDETGLTSLRFGVGFFAPGLKSDPAALVEAVIVFEKRYYS